MSVPYDLARVDPSTGRVLVRVTYDTAIGEVTVTKKIEPRDFDTLLQTLEALK